MISSYYYKGPENEPWEFEETELNKMNLLVGTSGSGKTKYLNTIFNFSDSVSKGEPFRSGEWRITVKTQEFEYRWAYRGEVDAKKKHQITYEAISRKPLNSQAQTETLVERTLGSFIFSGNKLPKLQIDKPSVTLLKEEETIRPLYETFAKVQRRNFHDAGLRDALALQTLESEMITSAKTGGIDILWQQENALSAKMFLLKENHQGLYSVATETFKQIFPSIIDCDIKMAKDSLPFKMQPGGIVPVFIVKEKGVSRWVGLHELSSGMQKVLLIITDILTLPAGSIYIIDEYENSLGVNAIDFIPQFLMDHGESVQFIITTHHPYLINNMPINSWRIFHRVGSAVSIKQGSEFQQKFGLSKQQAFIQLLNDPFYSGNEA